MISIDIVHNLIGKKGTSIKDIKKVASHPQALAQCNKYIQKHNFEKIEYSNTAIAALDLSKSNDTSLAVIASSEVAKLYDLEILETNVNESRNNTTRFAVFSKVLKTHKSYIINRDLEDNCKTCVHKKDCKELVDICTPIMLGDNNLGILGIVAFTEEQKNRILSKDQQLCEFINSMSNLISYKLDELYKAEIKTVEQLEKEEIEKAIKKYGSNTQEMKQVAKALDIGIATLYRKVKKYNIKTSE
jgi:transcriptional regulator with PAS, ATPase and Fis domain